MRSIRQVIETEGSRYAGNSSDRFTGGPDFNQSRLNRWNVNQNAHIREFIQVDNVPVRGGV